MLANPQIITNKV